MRKLIMDPKSMEKAMLKNMVEKTGNPLQKWVGIVNEQNFVENKDIVKFLKEEYFVGHFYAHLIAKKSK